MSNSILKIVAGVALSASLLMYEVGSRSIQLAELVEFFYFPLGLGVLCLMLIRFNNWANAA